MSLTSKFRQAFFPAALAAGIMLAVLCAICFWGIASLHGRPAELGWYDLPQGGHSIITRVTVGGPAFGKLRPGDQLLAINGQSRLTRFAPISPLTFAPGSYSVDVQRTGKALHFVLSPSPSTQSFFTVYSYLLIALLDFGLALWIGLARPDNPAARVAFFLFLEIARTFAATVLVAFHPPLSPAALAFCLLVTSNAWRPIGWALAFDFSLRFPEPIPQPALLRSLRGLLYTFGSVLFLAAILLDMAQALNLANRSSLLPHWFPLASFDRWQPALVDALGAFTLCSIPLILARNYRRLPDILARTRLRWVAVAITLATLPLAAGISLRFLFYSAGNPQAADGVQPFLDTFASFPTILLPLAVTYAIVKHRVLGIRFAIRRSAQYLLALNFLRVVLYLPLIALGFDLALHPKEPLQDFLLSKSRWFYLFFIGAALLSLRFRARLKRWVDERFFRGVYEEQVILTHLIERLHACETSADIARCVTRQLQATLHPSAISVLLRHQSAGTFTTDNHDDSPLALRFRELFDGPLSRLLQAERSAHTLSELASQSGNHSFSVPPDLSATLVTPITSAGDDLLGVVLLGERKSEQPYSKRDRQLLQAIAAQIALVFEMLGLKDRVREEGRVRVDVLGRLDSQQIQLILECPACGRCYTAPATHCASDNATLGMTLPIERVIEGKYRLLRRIGTGGMGAVYEASDLRLDRPVAVKVMIGRLFGNNVALRRFEREARAVARLQHPNIVAIHDFGPLRGDGAYLVMQLLSGHSWRKELSHGNPVPPPKAAVWFDQLCDAVAYAHSCGIVHRDLKPENVIVSSVSGGGESAGAGKITVVDFGLAKLHSQDHRPEALVSTEDAILGTYGYSSPEQRDGRHVDFRTDIYSIAVMVAETLSGIRPPSFGNATAWARTSLHISPSPPAWDSLISLLDTCLAPSANDRLSDIVQLQRALIPLLRECPTLVRPQAFGASADATPTTFRL